MNLSQPRITKNRILILTACFALTMGGAFTFAESMHAHEEDHSHVKGNEEHKDESKTDSSKKDKHKEDDHHEKSAHTKDDGHAHGKEEKDEHAHKEGEEEGHEEEEAPKNVGPNKGVLSFNEKDGFSLSKEALKNFEIKQHTLAGSSPWTIEKSGLLQSGNEVAVYRVRKGFFKNVDVKVLSKTSTSMTISSSDLQEGDSVAIEGVGFLRVAELDLTSGESGHHH